ncbi:MAG: carboxylesterase [Zetaproteobacteria bacterium CG12_big_fil_rev_8_21_14_0_65_55_1124]|nr:MAG: carboxylesterase [Zetaproteobacteria bacterium CG1_02_55_237]PIS19443.1 MAG: carboxylesterase [Zetaproteobacteria bacterium CG08_land_8_20_14_0_20_55_17]PIW43012.1 MAG: carboxylesterase [Zetaproteobacteria bacterium CG12_big_fil_rev_8_21_14_0_65_55_1124]PIY51551.1 MAG: carboxylesterase [Zetaproteobacteria bacterium CG_4_10_14_0_8_um_filter_55_43]PIZ39239.1 MAG: carboxylesterase [Zetaproteobacteria bacterium CG_4_10_14_0_2_um_filter_55_20]PJB80165.1 MAG: carboxylesterase [Zetaproteobact
MNLHILPHLTVETVPEPNAAIIWLHGLGADGHDFEPIVPQLGLKPEARIRFIFPHAPAMPVTINGGYVMPAWYDIRQTDLGIEHDEAGIAASAKAVQLLVEQQQMNGIAASRIVLAGFSQGAAMALHVGLAQEEALGGIMALSGYLLLPNKLKTHLCREALGTPLFMAHGINDPVVPFSLGEASHDRLQKLGMAVDWHSYPMAHQVCPKEIAAIGAWLNKLL